jgi:hypothetical protein
MKRRDGLWGRIPWFGITRWVVKEKTLVGRQTWDRQVRGGQRHLLNVVAPKRHLRQWSNLGWRAEKGTKTNVCYTRKGAIVVDEQNMQSKG